MSPGPRPRETARMKPRTHSLMAWVLAAAVLGSVFAAYLDPHAVVDLATRVWSCF